MGKNFICEECGNTCPIEFNVGDNICEDCYDAYYFTCEHCGDITRVDNLIANLCEYCYEHYYFTCGWCDEVKHEDFYEDKGLCNKCFYEKYFYCDKCGQTVEIEYRYESPDGDSLCEDCFNNDYFFCDICEEAYPYSEQNTNYTDGVVCIHCRSMLPYITARAASLAEIENIKTLLMG